MSLEALAGVPNLARQLFLDQIAQEFYAGWETVARDSVAALRIEAGRDPYNKRLTDLVGGLSTRSEAFRTWWATTTSGCTRARGRHEAGLDLFSP